MLTTCDRPIKHYQAVNCVILSCCLTNLDQSYHNSPLSKVGLLYQFCQIFPLATLHCSTQKAEKLRNCSPIPSLTPTPDYELLFLSHPIPSHSTSFLPNALPLLSISTLQLSNHCTPLPHLIPYSSYI